MCSSGFPAHIITEEDKKKYCDEISSELGVKIEPDEISLKKSKRLCMKYLLNTLWVCVNTNIQLKKNCFRENLLRTQIE